MQAPAPARLIEGGMPTEATIAQVLVSKYADHLPLYRQAQIYARQGIDLDRSTLADWVGHAAWHLRPLHERLLDKAEAAAPSCLRTRRPRRCSIPAAGCTKTGQLWAYAADDRPWGGCDPPGVVYVYAPDRKVGAADHPSGGLQGHPAGRRLCRLPQAGRSRRRPPCVLLVACSAWLLRARHLRSGADRQRSARTYRRALRRREGHPRSESPRSAEQSGTQRSRPLIDALEPWLRAKLGLISQKSKLAEAIRYALSRWEGLTRFIDDGRIELDNNTVERSIRPIALNRKNALFAGSDGGAEHWATVASLIETCKLNDVDPLGYLTDVLTRIVNGHPNRDIDQLLPWAYQNARPQSRGLKTTLTIVWHWGVDIMPLMDHGEHPPSGDAWSGDAALQAFKAAFFKWLNEQADD